ncbi:artemin [Spea bombifrons]|uniref:artemin n=1 Tax=Spea bombifrons TaxID=233779 RepID=UPI00234ACE20|nr:artemin [Spea bombifrons]
MLSFGQGDLTSRRRGTKQIQTLKGLHRNLLRWGETSKASREPYPEWGRNPENLTALRNRQTNVFTGGWYPKRSTGAGAISRQSENTGKSNDGFKLFMGRGSRCVTTPPWSCKVTLWTLVAALLLSSAMITGSPTPELSMEGQSSHETDSETFGTVSPNSMEPTQEEKTDLTISSTQSPRFENLTSEGNGDDEQLDVLFRLERSSEKPKRNKKPSSRKGSDEAGGAGGKECSLRKLRIKVRDLELGYDSDESITFSYCSGNCQSNRSNYDVTLNNLLKKKKVNHRSHGRISDQPCCRPTRFQPVSFMDVQNNWKVVYTLSAADCECVG